MVSCEHWPGRDCRRGKPLLKNKLIFANNNLHKVTDVEHELSACCVIRSTWSTVIHNPTFAGNERIEHPELYVFDVGFIEVNFRTNPGHDTSPVRSWVPQISILIQVRIVVVRSTLR